MYTLSARGVTFCTNPRTRTHTHALHVPRIETWWIYVLSLCNVHCWRSGMLYIMLSVVAALGYYEAPRSCLQRIEAHSNVYFHTVWSLINGNMYKKLYKRRGACRKQPFSVRFWSLQRSFKAPIPIFHHFWFGHFLSCSVFVYRVFFCFFAISNGVATPVFEWVASDRVFRHRELWDKRVREGRSASNVLFIVKSCRCWCFLDTPMVYFARS